MDLFDLDKHVTGWIYLMHAHTHTHTYNAAYVKVFNGTFYMVDTLTLHASGTMLDEVNKEAFTHPLNSFDISTMTLNILIIILSKVQFDFVMLT